MNPEIVVALLSLLGTLCGSLTGVLLSSKLVNYRLEQLEHMVGELGGMKERMALVEQSVKSAHKRIETLGK